MQGESRSPDSFDDLLGGLSPDERLGVAVVLVNVAHDGINQLGDASEDATMHALFVEVTKKTLDDIEPRTAGRDEMDVETLVSLEPSHYLRMFVRCVVIHDQMKIQIFRRLRVNLLEELDPLLVSVTRHAGGDDFALGHVDRRKESRCTVAFVIMGHRPASTGNDG